MQKGQNRASILNSAARSSCCGYFLFYGRGKSCFFRQILPQKSENFPQILSHGGKLFWLEDKPVFFRAYAARACTYFLYRQKVGKDLPKGEAFRFASPFGNPHPTDQGGGCGPFAWTRLRGADETARADCAAHLSCAAPAAAERERQCVRLVPNRRERLRAVLFGNDSAVSESLLQGSLFLLHGGALFFFRPWRKKKRGPNRSLLQNKASLGCAAREKPIRFPQKS